MINRWWVFGPRLCLILGAGLISLAEDRVEDHQALLQSSWQMFQQHLVEPAIKDHCISMCGHSSRTPCFDARCFQKPKVWGPPTWFYLHSLALSQEEQIPNEQQQRLVNFFLKDLSWLLPCPVSGENFRRHLANSSSISQALGQGRQGLVQWLMTVHNMVNRDLPKQERSVEEVMKSYASVFDTAHAPCFSEDGEDGSTIWSIFGKFLRGFRGLTSAEKPCVDAGCFRTSTVWGPPAWFFLHSMALALPKKIPVRQQAHIRRFLKDLSWLLPCPSCGENLRRRLPNMQSSDDAVHQGRDALVNWLVALHNSVSRDLNKTEISSDKAIELYANTFGGGAAPCFHRSSA